MHDDFIPTRGVVIYEEPEETSALSEENGLFPVLRSELTERTRDLLALPGIPDEGELTRHLQSLVRQNRALQFELGCLIVHGDGRRWYLDYGERWRSMEQWALYSIGDAALIRSAVAMYHTAVVLQKSRVDVMELVDSFSLTKAKEIMRESREVNRQAKTEAENIPGFAALSPKEQKARKDEIMARDQPSIAAKMRTILQMPDEDIEYNQKIRSGRPIHIPVYITGVHITRVGVLTGTLQVDLRSMSTLEQEALIEGHYYIQLFDVEGHPASYKKFLEDYIGEPDSAMADTEEAELEWYEEDAGLD